MKEKERTINECLNDDKTQKYYSNIIKKRYEFTMQLIARARAAYEEYMSIDLPLKSKNFSYQTIYRKLLEKDYSVPDNFISLLDHLLVLNQTYKMLADKDIPSIKEKISIFLAFDRVLHLLVEKVSWFTGYFQARWMNEKNMSKLRQESLAKKTNKRKQDCVKAYRSLLNDGKIKPNVTMNEICDVLIPGELKENKKFGDYKHRFEFENGPKKSDLVIPTINTIKDYIINEI